MPLLDHFRPPPNKRLSWEGFHGGWPMVIVQTLQKRLPAPYVAIPRIHQGPMFEIDVAAYESFDTDDATSQTSGTNGGVAVETSTIAAPTVAVTVDLPEQDEYEVLVYDAGSGDRLVAAIELVSPANKDRPDHRAVFVSKCIDLLRNGVSVTIVDLVTVRNFNLYADLSKLIGVADPSVGIEPSRLYAVACGTKKRGDTSVFEAWYHALELGKTLPTLPLWLADDFFVPLELEASYEKTCRDLRIA